MDRVNVFSGAHQSLYAEQSSDDVEMVSPSAIFTTIPPERVGLHGEYDHSGLAKRVKLAYGKHFESAEICNLKISQRGAVVVLVGEVASQWMLTRLVSIAMETEGTVSVEINGVSIFQPVQPSFSDSRNYLYLSSYALG
jgi:osmotically-inducible protein OsmY